MKLAFHFDAMGAKPGVNYRFTAYRLVFPAFLAQPNRPIQSKIFDGDLLFGHIPGRKASDVLRDWFFPQNPGWKRPNGVEWNLPSHMAIYVLCFESTDQKTAERLHEALTGSVSYLGVMEVGDSPVHRQLWAKLLLPFRIVGREARVFCEAYPPAGRDEGLREQLQDLGFDPVNWEELYREST